MTESDIVVEEAVDREANADSELKDEKVSRQSNAYRVGMPA